VNARKLQQLQSALAEFMEELTPDLGRKDRRAWAETYVRGLLLDGQRKSIEPMAHRLQEIDEATGDYEQSLQQFVNQSPWDERAIRRNLARWVQRRVKGEAFLLIDGVGLPKKGAHSVGVARQYCGTLGKVANCQIAVTLQLAHRQDVFGLDGELYLPKAWADDSERLQTAGVPEEVKYQAKWKLALTMVDRALKEGIEGIVLADSEFGSVTEFRNALSDRGLTYAVGIECTLSVVDASIDLGDVPPRRQQTGRPPSRPAAVTHGLPTCSVKQWALDHADDFRRVTWRQGSKGPMTSRFAAWRVRPGHRVRAGRSPLEPLWLVVEWTAEEEQPRKYYFCNLPQKTSLKKLVRTVRSRWPVEQSYRELKQELGLDHFEGRSWRGWHHHLTLVFLAYAFLVSVRRKKRGASTTRCAK
jgi:SRSO17 transposase